MSAALPAGGTTARLLDRAAGRMTALRPSIAPTFDAEGASEAPLVETTDHVGAAVPAAADPAAAVAAHARAAADAPAPQPQLEPTDPARPPRTRERLVAAEAPEPAVTSPAPLIAMAGPGPAPPPLPVLPTEPRPAAAPGEQRVAPALQAPLTEPFRLRRPDSLSAAIAQLLAPEGHATPEPAARSPASPATDMGEPALAGGAEPAARGGLTIHIGEVVIAPEPSAAQRERAPGPAWQPPLSLAEYRETRARERR